MGDIQTGLAGYSGPKMFQLGNRPITASNYLSAQNYEDTGSYTDPNFSTGLSTYQMPINIGDESWKSGTIFEDGAQPITPGGEPGAMDWLNQNSKGIGTAMGLAGLGMDAYSTFFGQGKDYFDKNMMLLNQQIADNQSKLDRQAAVSQAWSDTEKAKNSGLAATGK